MTIYDRNLSEKVAVVIWTTALMVTRCPVVLLDVVHSWTFVGSVGTLVSVLVCLALATPLSRMGENVTHWVPVRNVRFMLDVTLPVLGVTIARHPVTSAWIRVAKKFFVLEGQLWKQWCPQAYIIIISLTCMLAIVRRSAMQPTPATVYAEVNREKNLRLIKFAADHLCERHMTNVIAMCTRPNQ